MKRLLRSRKFRQGSMATAIAVAVIALVVVINFVATALTDRYSLTLDLTPGKVFSITDETKDYLSALEKDVTIYVMDTEESFTSYGEYYLQAAEVLKQYALASGRIQLEYVDLVANPTFASNYPDLQLSSSSILITSGDKVRDVAIGDLYDIQQNMYGQSQVTASKAEQVLTSAVLSVTSDTTVNVALLTGHNEVDVSAFTTLLTDNNYLTGEVNLSTGEGGIPAQYTVAVIAGPERDYTEDELRYLDDFLENDGAYGRTLLYLSPLQQSAAQLPNLSAFLSDWGIQIDDGLIQETDGNRIFSYYGQQDPYIAQLDYAETVYSEDARTAQQMAVAAYGRPMQVLFESQNGIAVSPLLAYAPSAAIIQNDAVAESDGAAIPFLTLSQKQTYSGTEPQSSQVLVCSSTAFLDQLFLDNPNFSNSEYMLGLLADLSGQESTVKIQSKSLGGKTLDMSQWQALITGGLLTIVLPLAVLIFGLVIWARRRHR